MAARTHELFSALGHPQRLSLLVYLLEQRGRSVPQSEILALAEFSEFHQSTTSQYLSVLAQAGLITKGPGKRGGYHVSMVDRVGDLVSIAAEICSAESELGASQSTALIRRIRKARMAAVKTSEAESA